MFLHRKEKVITIIFLYPAVPTNVHALSFIFWGGVLSLLGACVTFHKGWQENDILPTKIRSIFHWKTSHQLSLANGLSVSSLLRDGRAMIPFPHQDNAHGRELCSWTGIQIGGAHIHQLDLVSCSGSPLLRDMGSGSPPPYLYTCFFFWLFHCFYWELFSPLDSRGDLDWPVSATTFPPQHPFVWVILPMLILYSLGLYSDVPVDTHPSR